MKKIFFQQNEVQKSFVVISTKQKFIVNLHPF